MAGRSILLLLNVHILVVVMSMAVAIWLGTGGLVVVLRRLPVNAQLV